MKMDTTPKIAIGIFLAFVAGVILTKCTASDNNIKSSDVYNDAAQNNSTNASNSMIIEPNNNIVENSTNMDANNNQAYNNGQNNKPEVKAPTNTQKNDNSAINNFNNKKVDANTDALAAQSAVPSCSASAKRKLPVKSWNHLGTITATVKGNDCNNALVNMIIKGEDGKTLYNISAPARDFGINNGSSTSDIAKILDNSLPNSSVRASAYPKWSDGKNAPTITDFKRDEYETVRLDDSPVVCLKIPSAPQKCVAIDKNTNQMRTFSRD